MLARCVHTHLMPKHLSLRGSACVLEGLHIEAIVCLPSVALGDKVTVRAFGHFCPPPWMQLAGHSLERTALNIHLRSSWLLLNTHFFLSRGWFRVGCGSLHSSAVVYVLRSCCCCLP